MQPEGGGGFEGVTAFNGESGQNKLGQLLGTAHLAPLCGLNTHLLYHVEEVLTPFC